MRRLIIKFLIVLPRIFMSLATIQKFVC
jgi:hypothetical protein